MSGPYARCCSFACRRGHHPRGCKEESAGEGATGCRELTRGSCVRTVGFEAVTTVKGTATMTGEPSGLHRFVPTTVEGLSLRYLSALGRYTTDVTVCFRSACVNFDLHWPTVILMQRTR